jgi:hypothetical protein
MPPADNINHIETHSAPLTTLFLSIQDAPGMDPADPLGCLYLSIQIESMFQYDISISTLDWTGKSVVQTAPTPSSSNYLCADVLLAPEIPSLDMLSPVPYMTNANNWYTI